MHLTKKWHINIPYTFGLADVGFDDADIDSLGRLYICDSINKKVFRINHDKTEIESFDIISATGSALCIAAISDAGFYSADISSSVISRYDELGCHIGDFGVPGLISICSGIDGILYALAKSGYEEQICIYDQLGSQIDSIPISMDTEHHDPALINIDTDNDGVIYFSFGTCPYVIWKIQKDGVVDKISGPVIDRPGNTVITADITVNKSDNILWSLLAYRQFGRQMVDRFDTVDCSFTSIAIPRTDYLYGIICSFNDTICLIDTDTGINAGNVICYQFS